MHSITLTAEELRLAAYVEVARHCQNLEKHRFNDRGVRPDNWYYGIEGAAAEMAFAKYTNCYWSGAVGNLKAKDVGSVQIRSTWRQDGCLLLHPDDEDEDVFVLAIGVAPTFTFKGWLRAKDGKKPEYWRDIQRPCYFVPQDVLHSMGTKYARLVA